MLDIGNGRIEDWEHVSQIYGLANGTGLMEVRRALMDAALVELKILCALAGRKDGLAAKIHEAVACGWDHDVETLRRLPGKIEEWERG